MPLFRILSVVFCLLCIAPEVAQAQEQAAAEALFRSAQEAAKQGEWALACERFTESNRLDPAPGTVLNLARCHEELGHQASAWKFYKEAAEKLPEGDRRSEYALRKVATLEHDVPKITFEPPTQVGAGEFTLTVNGTVYSPAMLGVEIPFDAGTVKIVVEAPRRRAVITMIELDPGEKQTYRIRVGDVELERATQGGDTSQGRTRKSWAIASLTVGGVGAATAIFGAIWAGIELSTATDPAHCVDGSCDREGANASQRGRTAVVLLGSGAALATIGLTVGTALLLKKDQTSVAFAARPGGGVLTLTTHALFDRAGL